MKAEKFNPNYSLETTRGVLKFLVADQRVSNHLLLCGCNARRNIILPLTFSKYAPIAKVLNLRIYNLFCTSLLIMNMRNMAIRL